MFLAPQSGGGHIVISSPFLWRGQRAARRARRRHSGHHGRTDRVDRADVRRRGEPAVSAGRVQADSQPRTSATVGTIGAVANMLPVGAGT
jgi:hypothetical protein